MQFKASVIIVAPLFGLLTACGSANEPQLGQTVAQLFSSPARAEEPRPAPASATLARGPKSKTKMDTGRTAAPAESGTVTAPCVTTSPSGERAIRKNSFPSNQSAVGNAESALRTTAAPTGVEPLPTEDSARRGGPKVRDKMATGRTVTPTNDGATIAPCPAPADAASQRGNGRPKERDKIMTN